MNVSSVSSSAGSSYSSVSSSDEITQLEKQRANLEKELQKVNQSSEDAKTKDQKIKQLEMQIQQIDAQIQQKRTGRTGQSSGTVQKQVTAPPPQGAKQAGSIDGAGNSANLSDLLGESGQDSKIDVRI